MSKENKQKLREYQKNYRKNYQKNYHETKQSQYKKNVQNSFLILNVVVILTVFLVKTYFGCVLLKLLLF